MTSPDNDSSNSIPPNSNSTLLSSNKGSLANLGNNSTSDPHSTTPLHMVSGSHFGITSSGIGLTECTINETSWPSDLVLDLREYNWIEWSRNVTLLALQQGFAPWLDGSLPCPDATVAPGDYFIWKRNDGTLRYFIQSHVSLPTFTLSISSQPLTSCSKHSDPTMNNKARLHR